MVQFWERAEIVKRLAATTGMDKILLLRSSLLMDEILKQLGPEEKDNIASMWFKASFDELTYGMKMKIDKIMPECEEILQEMSATNRMLAASMWKAGSFSGENWNKGLLKL